jgi:hypothetical protein
MVIFASPAVVLYLYALSLEPSPPAGAREGAPGGDELPFNIQVGEEVKPAIVDLLSRSRTLREQCERIAAARHVRVAIATVPPSTFDAQMRARATARRYESGLLTVFIELPISTDLAELLGHELEHVIEFIDQVDLQMMAREQRGGVTQRTRDGAYETQRAFDAGRAAAAEIYEPDPAAAAFAHRVSKSIRAAWRFLVAAPHRQTAEQ